jgi:hypothetical protein
MLGVEAVVEEFTLHPIVYLETVKKTLKSSVRKVDDDDYVKMERLYIWDGC